MKLGIGAPLLLAFALGCTACEPRAATPAQYVDAPVPATCSDPCVCAAATLQALGCATYRPDFAEFCHAQLDAHQPLCPSMIAAATSCAEAEGACK